MAIKNMNLLNITFYQENVFDILNKVQDIQNFYPQKCDKLIMNVKNVKVMPKDDAYDKLHTKISSLAERLKFKLVKTDCEIQPLDITKTNQYLETIENNLCKIENVITGLQVDKEENEETQIILENIESHDLNLDHLFECKYLKIRFGRIPTKEIAKLKYYDSAPFILRKFKEDHEHIWCAYFGVKKDILEIDNIFSAIGFERIRVPSFVHGTIKEALDEVIEETNAMKTHIGHMEQKIKDLRDANIKELNEIYTKVVGMQKLYTLHDCVIDYGSLSAINGFVTVDQLDEIVKEFEEITGTNALILPSNMYNSQEVFAPIIRSNSGLIKPFESVSKVKSINDIDSTLLAALLWSLSFGAFVGDIGVGIIMLIIGSLFAKKGNFWKLITRLGAAILLGGLVYGTLFYNNVYQPLIAMMLDMPLRLGYLVGALIFGNWAIKCICSIMKKMKSKQIGSIVFGKTGLGALALIMVVVVGLVGNVQFGINLFTLPILVLILFLLVLTLIKKTDK